MEYHKALPAGWDCAEDSFGRVYFLNESRRETQWNDPRLDDSKFKIQDDREAPTIVKVGFALYEMQQEIQSHLIDQKLLLEAIQKYDANRSKTMIQKREFETIVRGCIDDTVSDKATISQKITSKIFSLLDLKYKGEISTKEGILSLIFLSGMLSYKKFQFAFVVLDDQKKNSLDKETLFYLFKYLTKLVENNYLRYKIAISDNQLRSDVSRCMEKIVVTKKRVNDETITFNEFIKYVLDDPLIIRMIPMMEKIQKSRDSIHKGKTCQICAQSPIKGIRYKEKDGKANYCENCFWKGTEKKITTIEYPTPRTRSKISRDQMNGRICPVMPHLARDVDREALRGGELIEPSQGAQSRLIESPSEATTKV